MSGEAVVDSDGNSVISTWRLDEFCDQIALAREKEASLQIAVVVGGGNMIRGKLLTGVSRIKADHMGMLATVINALALQDAMTRAGLVSRVLTGIEMPKVAEPYIHGRAMRHLEKNHILIFAGGMGSPYFTTDTAAALRAAEIGAEVMLLAKFKTDGVYNMDPNREADAVKYVSVDFDTVISKNLQVMDATAVALCRENGVPIYVFDMGSEGAVTQALLGKFDSGTYIADSVPVVTRPRV